MSNSGKPVVRFQLPGQDPYTSGKYTSANFEVGPDGGGGTIVGYVCFPRRAHIATPEGEMAMDSSIPSFFAAGHLQP